MKKLTDLLEHVEYKCLQGTTDKEITGVVYDSRKAEPGCLFLCIKGAVSDGHSYAASVAEKGAAVLVVQDPVDVPKEVTVLQVKDSRYAMACIAAAWFDYPAKKLKTIGITGTKGKTTTTYLVKSILENAGHKTGLIGTIETIIGDIRIPFCQYHTGILSGAGIFCKNGRSGLRQCSYGGFFSGSDAPPHRRLCL